jgi:hypothetical protein
MTYPLFFVLPTATYLVPFSREQMENQSPLGVSSPKLSSSKEKCSLPVFFKQLLLFPSWALIFCKNSNSLLLQKPAKSC